MAVWHGFIEVPENTFALRAHLLNRDGLSDRGWYGKLTDLTLDELDGLHNQAHQLLADLNDDPNHGH